MKAKEVSGFPQGVSLTLFYSTIGFVCVWGKGVQKLCELFKKSRSITEDVSQNTLSLALSLCSAAQTKGNHSLRPYSWCLLVIIFFAHISSTHSLSSHKCWCRCRKAVFSTLLLFHHALSSHSDFSGHMDQVEKANTPGHKLFCSCP